jgi:hypothetical protein
LLPTQPRRSPRISPPTEKKADTEWKSTNRHLGKKKGKIPSAFKEPIPFVLPPLPTANKNSFAALASTEEKEEDATKGTPQIEDSLPLSTASTPTRKITSSRSLTGLQSKKETLKTIANLFDKSSEPPKTQTKRVSCQIALSSTSSSSGSPPVIKNLINLPLMNHLPCLQSQAMEQQYHQSMESKESFDLSNNKSQAESPQRQKSIDSIESSELSYMPDEEDMAKKVQFLLPKLPFATRFDVKVTTVASTNALRTLVEALTSVLDRLQAADPTVILYPWGKSTSTEVPALQDTKAFPTTNRQLKLYFEKLLAKEAGGISFTSLYIGHTCTAAELIEEVDMEFWHQKSGLYLRCLQVAEIAEIGWLSYSTQDMNLTVLRKELEKMLKIQIDVC